MIDGLKPYPAYKDSSVPWMGRLPEHWQIQRQRNLARMLVSNVDKNTVDGEVPIRLCNYVDVYSNDRITDQISFMRASASKVEINRFRLELGDVIITKDSEAWNDIAVPALVDYAPPDLVCGYHLAILRPRQDVILGAYIFRALQTQQVAVQYHVAANGVTRYGLSHDAIKSVQLPVPSLTEQSAIVRYLNHADQRIRHSIRAKKKLIALLIEQKRAIVENAVSRGLEPNVTLKQSGVDWLGNVPAHWIVAPCDSAIINAWGKWWTQRKLPASGWSRIFGTSMFDGTTSIRPTCLSLISRHMSGSDSRSKPETCWFAKAGISGGARFWKGDIEVCGFQKALHRLRPLNPNADYPRFLYYCMYLASVKDAFNMNKIDNTIPHLTGVMLRAPLRVSAHVRAEGNFRLP